MESVKGDFLIDLSSKYKRFRLLVKICASEEEFYSIEDYIISCIPNLKKTKPHQTTNALHAGINNTDDGFPNPIGLLLFKNNFTMGTMVHEVFHAARHYFKLIKKNISHNKDETFAKLLDDIVYEFNYEFAKFQKKISQDNPNPIEPNRKASTSKVEASND